MEERELRIADAELGLRLDEDTGLAETALLQLHDEAAAAGDAIAASRVSLALGLASAAAGRNAEAIERLEAGLDVSPVSPSLRPEVFATLGRAYTATSRPDLAAELFERCLGEIAEDAPEDVAARVRFTTHLGDALNELDELERAQSLLDAARACGRGDRPVCARPPLPLARPAERIPWAASDRARVRATRSRTARGHGRPRAVRAR